MCARVHAPRNTGARVPTTVQESKVGRGGGGGAGPLAAGGGVLSLQSDSHKRITRLHSLLPAAVPVK